MLLVGGPSAGSPSALRPAGCTFTLRIPAKSTLHAVLHRHGLVKAIRRPRPRATGTPLSAGAAPNDRWCADFKGEFKLGNGHYCYPLTVTDHASRLLLLCEAFDSTREDIAITGFEQLFLERGLPAAIRSDNGVPFARPNALFNLSQRSVWWLRLGIAIERIRPGHPQQNGRHERRHLTLKKEEAREVKAAKVRPNWPKIERAQPGAPFIRYRFSDGGVWNLDIASVEQRLAAVKKSWVLRQRGAMGGRPTKTQDMGKDQHDVDGEILLLFGEMLFDRERYADRPVREARVAWNRARIRVVKQVANTYAVNVRTARRWTDRALGPR